MRKLSLLFYLLPFAAIAGPGSTTTVNQKQPLCLLENKGQVKDQYGKYRADIDYVIHDEGVNVFVSAKGISYQWNRSLLSREGGLRDLPGSPENNNTGGAIEFCRVDAELVRANAAAKLRAENKQDYYETYYHPAFGAEEP